MAVANLTEKYIEVKDLDGTIPRDQLTPIFLFGVRANRSESGSGGWKTFYFLSEEDGSSFWSAENDQGGSGVDPVRALHDGKGNYYFAQ